MRQSIMQVDAFSNQAFRGNPAAVCVLSSPQDEGWMQSVAQEMNLSETAFVLKQNQNYRLRWFTPTTEVPLCGHGTLASAHVLWTEGYASTGQKLKFETKSGILTARYEDDWIELDFPANRSQDIPPITKLGDALGVRLKTVSYNSLGYLVEVASAEQVKLLQPISIFCSWFGDKRRSRYRGCTLLSCPLLARSLKEGSIPRLSGFSSRRSG